MSGKLPDDVVTWTTSDFSIAAYLHSLGVRLVHVSAQRGGHRRDCDFHFDNRSGKCPEMAIRFVNSDVFLYDQGQRALKKLVFGWREPADKAKERDKEHRTKAGKLEGWFTTDFPLASYVLSRGAEFVGFHQVRAGRREYTFYFSDDDGTCDDLAMAFVNSAAHRFDQSQRALKKLVFGR